MTLNKSVKCFHRILIRNYECVQSFFLNLKSSVAIFYNIITLKKTTFVCIFFLLYWCCFLIIWLHFPSVIHRLGEIDVMPCKYSDFYWLISKLWTKRCNQQTGLLSLLNTIISEDKNLSLDINILLCDGPIQDIGDHDFPIIRS